MVDYLKDRHKIEIQLDKQSARRRRHHGGHAGDGPCSKGVSLRAALQLMLRNMQPELTYVIKEK